MNYRSRWVLPIDRPPIDGGWVQVRDGQIASVGTSRPDGESRDLGDVAVLPGLVNAHTHLELSWMAGLVPSSPSMDAWIRTLMRIRRAGAPGGLDTERAAALDAVGAMRDSGTVLVGDIANSLLTPDLIAGAGLGGVVFHELTGFQPKEPHKAVQLAWERVEGAKRTLPSLRAPLRLSVVAHAPYSVSPTLFREIVRAAEEARAPLSIHLAESPEEVEFIRTGRGPIRDAIEALGVWNDLWSAPACEPDEYIARLGYLRPGLLVTHGVHLTVAGLERLRAAGAVLVTCPRSNLWVGAGSPNIAQFFGSGLPVAIGTDSLASVATLNLFDELAELRRLAPEVTAASLLESATRVGAEALGLGDLYGTIAPKKRAALIAVRVPAHVRDVEEYLVGGISAGDVEHVQWGSGAMGQ